MPDERVLVIVFNPRRVAAALRDVATFALALALLWGYLFFGCAWAGV